MGRNRMNFHFSGGKTEAQTSKVICSRKVVAAVTPASARTSWAKSTKASWVKEALPRLRRDTNLPTSHESSDSVFRKTHLIIF